MVQIGKTAHEHIDKANRIPPWLDFATLNVSLCNYFRTIAGNTHFLSSCTANMVLNCSEEVRFVFPSLS